MTRVRGIQSYAGYVPYRRLHRAAIAEVFGGAPRTGTALGRVLRRGHHDDGLRGGPPRAARRSDGARPTPLWFATAEPAYLDKTNATAIHAALRLDADVPPSTSAARCARASARSRAALDGNGTRARRRRRHARRPADGRRRSRRRRRRRRAARRRRRRRLRHRRVPRRRVARPRSSSTAGATPGDSRSQAVGGALRRDASYVPLGEQAWNAALKRAELTRRPGRRRRRHRARTPVRSAPGRASSAPGRVADDLAAPSATPAPRTPALLLAAALDQAEPGQMIAARRARRRRRRAAVPHDRRARVVTPAPPGGRRRSQTGAPVPYGKFLSWRGMVTVEPPRRPEPDRDRRRRPPARSRTGSSASSARRDREPGDVHLPPGARRVEDGDSTTWSRRRWPTCAGTIVTFTVDRLAYSPSPPIVFAVVDFDGGGRFPVRAHRRRRGGGADRRPRRDDVPPAVHRRRHPQLLLEGPPASDGGPDMARTASRTGSPSSAMACTPFGEHWNKSPDDLLIDAARETLRHRPASTKDDVDAYWLGTAQSGMTRHRAGARRSSCRTSRSPASRTTAPPAPRRCGRRRTRSPAARTTSPWRSASRR